MIPQRIATRLMTALLCTVSTCGTLALFSSVPLIAHIVASLEKSHDQSLKLAKNPVNLVKNSSNWLKTSASSRLTYPSR